MDFRSGGEFRENPNPQAKAEGVVFPPVPFVRSRAREAARPGLFLSRDGQPPCEMCGAPVITAHCKTICLRCGFMTGCSDGI